MPRGANLYDEARIQGRNRANANALNVVSPGIVTDGLVLHMDAGNRVSYPAGGATWYDISPSAYIATNVGTYAFDISGGGCIDYDRSGDDDGFATIPNFIVSSPELSAFAWVNADNLTNEVNGVIFTNYILSTRTGPTGDSTRNYNSFALLHQNSNIIGQVFSPIGQVIYGTPSGTPVTLSTGQWYYVGFRTTGINGGPLDTYVNGVLDRTNTLTGDRGIAQKTIGVATFRAETNNYCWDGKIGAVHIYNKCLSPDEILQNYNATKARYV